MSAEAVGCDLSVVVLSWNTAEATLACVAALAAEAPRCSREVIVVDNDSDDDTAARITALFPTVRLLRNDHNAGYSEGNNIGVRRATGRYVCLLNSDTEVRPAALDRLVDFLDRHPEYGAVAPQLINPDGRVQTACMRFPGLATAWCFDTVWGRFPPGSWVVDRYFMRDFDHLHSRDVEQPPGACLLMRRAEYLDLWGLDPSFFLFFGDVDLCRRLQRAGRKIRYLANSVVMHRRGVSTDRFPTFVVTWHRDRITYYRKHFGAGAVPYLRLIVRLRAIEEWVRVGRARQRDTASAERAELRRVVRDILAP